MRAGRLTAHERRREGLRGRNGRPLRAAARADAPAAEAARRVDASLRRNSAVWQRVVARWRSQGRRSAPGARPEPRSGARDARRASATATSSARRSRASAATFTRHRRERQPACAFAPDHLMTAAGTALRAGAVGLGDQAARQRDQDRRPRARADPLTPAGHMPARAAMRASAAPRAGAPATPRPASRHPAAECMRAATTRPGDDP